MIVWLSYEQNRQNMRKLRYVIIVEEGWGK